jgi:hypothetical protein
LKLGYKMEAEDRLLTREEAYVQVIHSASLFKAILKFVDEMKLDADRIKDTSSKSKSF